MHIVSHQSGTNEVIDSLIYCFEPEYLDPHINTSYVSEPNVLSIEVVCHADCPKVLIRLYVIIITLLTSR